MKSMKNFRKNYGAPISVIMSAAMIFNMLAVLPVSAYQVHDEVWVEGHNETRWVDGHYNGTNWVDGYEFTFWVPGNFKDISYWVDEEDEDEEDDGSTKEPINTQTGNNYFTEKRLYVPCPNIPLELNLKYQSVTNGSAGRLGQGWRHSYEWTLDVQTNDATLYTGSGNKLVFEKNTNGFFQPPEGSRWKITASGGGHEIALPGGKIYGFDSAGCLNTIQNS